MSDTTRGLPEAARKRVEQQRLSGVRSSLFSAPAAAAAKSAGLAAVGEVFGCLVMNLGWAGTGCNWYLPYGSNGFINYAYGSQPTSPIITSARGGKYSGFTPYVKAFEAAWNGALSRMLAEARALGAEGVVGIRIERTLLQNRVWEFTAMGTAVRSTDVMLAPRPATAREVWSTNFSTEDAASAILSGFMPREVVLGMSVATKHEDWQLRQQRTGWLNQEVVGMSQLIQAARNEARTRIEAHATHTGGAHLVINQMELREFETECGQEGVDLHAEATFVGTTLVPVPRFRGRPESARVLTVIPLKDL
jgi:uncharacterized protein YbjQ (UPF0145 family)